ncbi:MAG: SPOR domain-containing protein [Bacteroidia bacterium]|nr:SPOR domain-containing protein [Bacteroidia bacterium]NNF31551.1 HU-CCDC81 and SPOR domain-containing protein [Flavobacteriaceae bacterium]MBT8275626.1 SPOR domain-containing protein [Bacteroidia bacterium]NNJ82381.1 HU-CCDC81 and SPOR domain-containing protein [Flavobacteriaceae bacterium]NNK54130.1 HU-CCDC81 and SPOR domain-containing protein [Flavobacteriaceae bacterium]
MQLETYIKDLLYRYECVILPGFGAFLTHYRSARIDGVSHTFYPPAKSVSFNRQLQTNDGLLANYIAAADSCSYETALQRIRNFSSRLSRKLHEGQAISLNGIGDFQMNKEGSVQFVPSASENYDTASFGLASFISPEISRQVQTTQSEVEPVDKTPILFTPGKRTSVPYMKYAAIGLIAIALSSLGGMKLYEDKVQKHNFSEREKADALVENQIQEATFIISDPLPAMQISVPKEYGRYHIVAGAFRIEANAYKKLDQLADKGYTGRIIGKNKYGLHQVIYSSHQDRLEALRELRIIKRTENSDAWLLVKSLGTK